MKDQKDYQKQTEERRGWLTSDPATLIVAAREGLHEIPENARAQVAGPLEEIIARYESQSRAALGSSFAESTAFVGSGH